MSKNLPNQRRAFLKGAGLTLTGFGLSSMFPTPIMQYAMADEAASDRRFFFIFLRGANDGLNTLIPHGDPDYNTTHRPTLYRPYDPAFDLNGFASLNPAMADLMDLYGAGELALIHRVGYPNQSRSHFDSQRIWENGDPTTPFLFDGWLYRFVHEHAAAQSGKFPAFGSPNVGTLMSGAETYHVDVANPAAFSYTALAGTPNQGKYRDGWTDQYAGLSRYGMFREALAGSELKLQDFIDEYGAWDQVNWNPTDPNNGDFLFPASAEQDPAGRFGGYYAFFQNLKVGAMSLLESDPMSANGTRIAGAQIGGFDTHENQDPEGGDQFHRRLLEALAYGIRSLSLVLSGQADDPISPRAYASVWDDTLVCTLSEFGRTTIENGSQGTDHGEAGAVIAAGGTVSGGVYNCDPSTWTAGPGGVMLEAEGRYLSHRTDYRALFWEILRDHMGADPANVDTIFPGYTQAGLQELGLLT